jgi:hypothetical protein
MIKLITPPGMLLTVALLAIYSAYAFLIGLIEKSWIMLAGGAVSVVACYGTAMLRKWSQYLVYALAMGFLAKLFSSVLDGIRAGYFEFQFDSAKEILWSLTPSLLMVALSFVCCWLVYQHYRPATGATVAVAFEPAANLTESAALTAPSSDA